MTAVNNNSNINYRVTEEPDSKLTLPTKTYASILCQTKAVGLVQSADSHCD